MQRVNLIVANTSQYLCVSNHHAVVYLKLTQWDVSILSQKSRATLFHRMVRNNGSLEGGRV